MASTSSPMPEVQRPQAAGNAKPTSSEHNAANPQTAGSGYKLVKVRKADGTVATVRRKISPEEEGTHSSSATKQPETATVDATKFKIVTVRKPDGTFVKVKRPIKTTDEATATSSTDDVPPVKAAGSSSGAAPEASTTTKVAGVAQPTPAIAKREESIPTAAGANETTVPAHTETGQDPGNLEEALAAQERYNREKRTHRFKTQLLKGFGMIVGSSLPGLELSHDFEDGDEILSDGDFSGDEMDDDIDEGHGHDDTHDDGDNGPGEELHSRAIDDDGEKAEAAGDHTSGTTHVNFDAGAAIGGLASGMAASAAGQPPPPRPPPPAATATKAAGAEAQNGATKAGVPNPDKNTYKISAKELNEMEKKRLEGASEKRLQSHWTDVTFYLMAGLSIILPALFIVLTGFIAGMNGKLFSSSWGRMDDAIKIAVSAWPIVFAAVVAQCFKAWATWRVERGIKLMELEQLVGSNSFASAVKQPLLLRRLDLLSLTLFLVWCLSPLGSQALQRVYTLQRQLVEDVTPIYVLNSYGANRMFSPDSSLDRARYHDLLELVSSSFVASFTPDSRREGGVTDRFGNPIMHVWNGPDDYNPPLAAAFGVPIIVPQATLSTEPDNTQVSGEKSETLSFNMTYSYFNFTCGPLSVTQRGNLSSGIYWSSSSTFGTRFFASAAATGSPIDRVQLASANNPPTVSGTNGTYVVSDTQEYSQAECGFNQVFMETTVECTYDIKGGSLLPDCKAMEFKLAPQAKTRATTTNLTDFSYEFAFTGSPNTIESPVTPSEQYLRSATKLYGSTQSTTGMNLSAEVSQADLSSRFGYIFNTWMTLGYCPECLSLFYTETADAAGVLQLYSSVAGTRKVTDVPVFSVDMLWLGLFAGCAALLVIAGCLGVAVEALTVAPDVLGYVSTVARNSRYLQLPKTSSAMSGGQRAQALGGVKVMMQDVRANGEVGRIALGLKHEKAQRLEKGRLYR